jgi:hypothetical protein
MKPRIGKLYRVERTGMDRFYPHATTPNTGDVVRTIKSPHGCPKFGAMGHGYVADPWTDEFIGLVALASLREL